MKLYDFSIFANRLKERKAAEDIAGLVANLNQPGSVVELKLHVTTWFSLHKNVLKQANLS